MKSFLHSLWSDDRGQSTVEYIMILAVVVMVAMQFRKRFGKTLETAVDNIGNELDKGTKMDGFGN